MKLRDLTGLPLPLRLTQEASGNPLTDREWEGRDVTGVSTADERSRTVARLDRLRRPRDPETAP